MQTKSRLVTALSSSALVLSGLLLVPSPASAAPDPAAQPHGSDLEFASPTGSPKGIAMTADGTLLVTDTYTESINEFSRTGELLGEFASLPNARGGAQQLAIDSAGYVYVTLPDGIWHQDLSRTSQVHKYDKTGAPVGQWAVGGPNDAAEGIAISPSDEVYVSTRIGGKIYKFDALGNPLASWNSTGPQGLSTDGSGNVYVAESTAEAVKKYSPTGALLATFSTPGERPVSVGVDSESHVYAGGAGGYVDGTAMTSNVHKFAQDGTELASWNSGGDDNSAFNTVSALLFAEEDYLYLADTVNGRIVGMHAPYITPVISTTSLPPATVGVPYSATIAATGRPKPEFIFASGFVPTGLSLSGDGVLSGMPTEAGSFGFTVVAISGTLTDSMRFDLTIAQNALPTPDVSFTGVLKVGQTLTALASTTPAAGSYAFEWLADGAVVGEGATYELKPADKHKSISTRVTAKRDGYVSSSATSAASAPVATSSAPTVSLAGSASSLRLGKGFGLSWTSFEADSVVASNAWSGPKGSAGSESVSPTAIGVNTYAIAATNANGTTYAQTAIKVTLPAAKLAVKTPSKAKVRGKFRVRVTGLASGEAYRVLIGKKKVASGKASKKGTVSIKIKLPKSAKKGKRVITVVGSLADRAGKRSIKLTR